MGNFKVNPKKMKTICIILLIALSTVAAKKAGKGRRLGDDCKISTNGRCGSGAGNGQYCKEGAFCSQFSWCGVGAAWSAKSANSKYDGSAACVKAQSAPKKKASPYPIVQHTTLWNKGSGKVLSVNQEKYEAGTKIVQWQHVGQDNQVFEMTKHSATDITLKPIKGSGISTGKAGSNMGVVAEGSAQHYTLEHVGDWWKVKIGNDCLDVAGESKDNGGNIIFYGCKSSNMDNQLWRFASPSKPARRNGAKKAAKKAGKKAMKAGKKAKKAMKSKGRRLGDD